VAIATVNSCWNFPIRLKPHWKDLLESGESSVEATLTTARGYDCSSNGRSCSRGCTLCLPNDLSPTRILASQTLALPTPWQDDQGPPGTWQARRLGGLQDGTVYFQRSSQPSSCSTKTADLVPRRYMGEGLSRTGLPSMARHWCNVKYEGVS